MTTAEAAGGDDHHDVEGNGEEDAAAIWPGKVPVTTERILNGVAFRLDCEEREQVRRGGADDSWDPESSPGSTSQSVAATPSSAATPSGCSTPLLFDATLAATNFDGSVGTSSSSAGGLRSSGGSGSSGGSSGSHEGSRVRSSLAQGVDPSPLSPARRLPASASLSSLPPMLASLSSAELKSARRVLCARFVGDFRVGRLRGTRGWGVLEQPGGARGRPSERRNSGGWSEAGRSGGMRPHLADQLIAPLAALFHVLVYCLLTLWL